MQDPATGSRKDEERGFFTARVARGAEDAERGSFSMAGNTAIEKDLVASRGRFPSIPFVLYGLFDSRIIEKEARIFLWMISYLFTGGGFLSAVVSLQTKNNLRATLCSLRLYRVPVRKWRSSVMPDLGSESGAGSDPASREPGKTWIPASAGMTIRLQTGISGWALAKRAVKFFF